MVRKLQVDVQDIMKKYATEKAITSTCVAELLIQKNRTYRENSVSGLRRVVDQILQEEEGVEKSAVATKASDGVIVNEEFVYKLK